MTTKHAYVHGGGTTLHVDRLASTKSRAALALAVSLWIATGGVASADTTVTVGSGETVQYVYNGEKGDTSPWTVHPAGEKTYYHTVINGGTVTQRVLGGFSHDSNANSNTVTATSATITGNVYGGCSDYGTGNATGNTVMLTDTIVENNPYSNVYGGYSYGGDATGKPLR